MEFQVQLVKIHATTRCAAPRASDDASLLHPRGSGQEHNRAMVPNEHAWLRLWPTSFAPLSSDGLESRPKQPTVSSPFDAADVREKQRCGYSTTIPDEREYTVCLRA